MKRLVAGAYILFLVVVAQAQNWPRFRGVSATGLADGMNLPLFWDVETSENILWKTPIPGLSHSSPVVWGDRVFFTTAISSDPNPEFRRAFALEGVEAAAPSKDMSKHTWRIYCLDRRTGKIIWDKLAHEGLPRVQRHPKSSQASQTPATDGKYIVAMFGSEGLFCFDFSGNLLWRQDLGIIDAAALNGPQLHWGPASSPIIYKNLVFAQCDTQKAAFLAAFDLKTGKKVWSVDRPLIASWSTPTIYEGKGRTELLTNGSQNILSYDPMTGKQLWTLKGTSIQSIPTPFAVGELLYFFSGSHSHGPIVVVRAGANGDITPQTEAQPSEFIAWTNPKGAPEIPTPLVYGDYLYVVSNNGILSCYKAKTGERAYQQRVAGRGGAFTASPIAADGRIYLTAEDGEVHVVKAGPAYELLASNPMGDVCMATPAASPGILIYRTLHNIYGIGGQSSGAHRE
jgi:outer membrane protein assembly factor BamB